MAEQEYLTGKEHDAYVDEISDIIGELIPKIISVADKYNVDRDNAVQHFSRLFGAMAEISTFKDYDLEGEHNGG